MNNRPATNLRPDVERQMARLDLTIGQTEKLFGLENASHLSIGSIPPRCEDWLVMLERFAVPGSATEVESTDPSGDPVEVWESAGFVSPAEFEESERNACQIARDRLVNALDTYGVTAAWAIVFEQVDPCEDQGEVELIKLTPSPSDLAFEQYMRSVNQFTPGRPVRGHLDEAPDFDNDDDDPMLDLYSDIHDGS